MFSRVHHRRIAKLLDAFDEKLLADADCYFAGGTAIVLCLGEYRESLDVDFICASSAGYRLVRNAVGIDLGQLLKRPVKHLREVRSDRDKVSTFVEVDGESIKVELFLEARISISGAFDPALQVPTLSRQDMFAEKLLANADRGLDTST